MTLVARDPSAMRQMGREALPFPRSIAVQKHLSVVENPGPFVDARQHHAEAGDIVPETAPEFPGQVSPLK